MKQIKQEKEEPDFFRFPNTTCAFCGGRGQVYSHSSFFSAVYKECPECKGKRTHEKKCIKCSAILDNRGSGSVCMNNKCSRIGLVSVIYNGK